MVLIKNSIYFRKISEWDQWLEKNHNTETEIWLVLYKKSTGKPTLNYNETVETALCFGWIDSIVKKIDEERYAQKYTPRKNYKKWSETNVIRIQKLISENRIRDFELKKIPQSILGNEYFIEKKTSALSRDLEKLLESNKLAFSNFQKLPSSHKKTYINWVMNAKKEETRFKRIAQAIEMLEKNQKLGLK